MKTPESWCADFYREFCSIHSGHEAFIERIQQDAMAHQRTLDATVCDKFHGMDAATCNSIKAEILKDL
jgi:hypothetical protein